MCTEEELEEYQKRIDRFKRRLEGKRYPEALKTIQKARLICDDDETVWKWVKHMERYVHSI
jgi:hypothetical protein